MKIDLPEGKYVKGIEINDTDITIDFRKRKKIALVFICLNERYWPYLKQVIEDCKKNFLPQHNVEYFVWTDIPEEDTPELKARLDSLIPTEILTRMYEDTGLWFNNQHWGKDVIEASIKFIREAKDIHIIPTGGIDWPLPTLMRYHLFLNEEERLAEHDYIFYLDADMRVVQKVSDEILGEGLTTAPHPGYFLDKRFIPPLEPNPRSTAYIQRLGQYVEEGGKKRFLPFYSAGGFQGGTSKLFIKAMKEMKNNIDRDFNANYTAIWNDESHWNKYLWDYKGPVTFLDPSYVYPDSLIKEYYEPIWGRSYEPKIVTITKHFSLSKEGGDSLNKMIGADGLPTGRPFRENYIFCAKCNSFLPPQAGHYMQAILKCDGSQSQHEVQMRPLK